MVLYLEREEIKRKRKREHHYMCAIATPPHKVLRCESLSSLSISSVMLNK